MSERSLSAQWRRLALPDLPRSSHVLTFHEPSSAFLFSGELQPREPVLNDVVLANLGDTEPNSFPVDETVAPDNATPDRRVGAAAAATGDKTYVFSGRAGKEFDTGDTTLYEFSVSSKKWRSITSKDGAIVPPARSYHAMAATKSAVYLHAGCGATGGRLKDLWRFDLISETWTHLADAPGPERGGTSITVSHDGSTLYRIGGFDGKQEIGGLLDVYSVTEDKWTSIPFGHGPTARSVAGLALVALEGKEYLIYLFGESSPSNVGHAGAGKFFGDAFTFDIEAKTWLRIESSGESPAPRGWFAAVAAGDSKVLIQGGLGASNERLGDWWLMNLSVTA